MAKPQTQTDAQQTYPTSPWTDMYAPADEDMTSHQDEDNQAEEAEQPILDALSAVYNS